MALDSSGDSSAMFGSKMESSMLDEDLEDGEIASDEDEGDEPMPEKQEESQEIKKPEPATPTSVAKTPKSEKNQEDNDFAKDLQKLKEEVERKKENRRDPKKRRENDRDRDRGDRDRDRERDRDRDRDNKSRNRKRRASDENDKSRKEKKKKSDKGSEKDPDEEIEDDEMLGLNIRGASPTLDTETKIWSGKQPIIDPNWQFDDNSENDSDFEDRDDRKRRRRDKDRRNFKASSREDRETKKRLQMKRKKNRRDDNSDMICINFMKGNCTKGNDCHYSHAVCPPKKMELCKFYLMDCCAKRDKCLYLHDEFPCKFFHTGLKCYSGNKCKFSHDPLNSLSKDILLKHLETAPKEILGDFPRLSRDCAETMVNNKTTGKPNDTSKIPSLFDIQVSIPAGFQGSDKNDERTTPPCSPPPNVKTSPKTKPKFYQEQDFNDNDRNTDAEDFAKQLEAYKNIKMQNKGSESSLVSSDDKNQGFNAMAYFSNSVSGNQPSNISDSRSEDEEKEKEKPHRRHKKHKDENNETESDEKGEKRRRRKHEDKHKSKRNKEDKSDDEYKKSRKERRSSRKEMPEKTEITPAKLAEDGSFGGIKFKISSKKEIRKSSDSDRERDLLLPSKIEKPNEFLSSDDEKPLNYFVRKNDNPKRETEENQDKGYEEEEKFGVEYKPDVEDETDDCENENNLIIETNDDPEEEERPEPTVPKHLPKKQQELFMRIQAQQHQKLSEDENKSWKEENSRERRTSVGSGNESDAEVGKTPSASPSADADDNWYSSDDDNGGGKKESPIHAALKNLENEKKPTHLQTESTRSHTPPLKGNIDIGPISTTDLSKINITALLSSIRQITGKSSSDTSKFQGSTTATSYEPPKIENPVKMNFFNSEPEKKDVNKDPRLRDPRTHSEGKITATRRTSEEKPYGKSIYDSANFKFDNQDSDLRIQAKSDSDERVPRLDAVVPFGDVDLRTLNPPGGQSGKDFDLRNFGLPFKPVPVHTAATEIDASLASHPPISYKLDSIEIPLPDFSALKISPSDPQVKKDPRLRRLFRINSSDADPKEEQKKSGLPTDPRQRKNVHVADTPKSPTETPFSPKQSDQQPILGNNQGLLSANLLLLAQLGLSAAAGGAPVFDPRLQQLFSKNPQEFEMLRNQLANIKSQADFDIFRNQLLNCENPDMMRPTGTGLLPTPMGAPGMGLLGPAPNFMMPGMGMPDPSIMIGQMGPMGPNPMGFDPRFAGNQGGNNAGNDEDMDNNDVRHFNRGFRNDRRGRGNWRGNRDRNWDRDNRRHNKRDDSHRNRHNRDRDDRRERKRSSTPD